MRALAIAEKTTGTPVYAPDSIIRFEEGLVGFPDCKSFVLMAHEDIAPLRRLQSTDHPEIGFFAIDPGLLLPDYPVMIPAREWESLGLHDIAARIVLAICILGPTPGESTGNMQAPVLINYQKMTGKQVILPETTLLSRHPLL